MKAFKSVSDTIAGRPGRGSGSGGGTATPKYTIQKLTAYGGRWQVLNNERNDIATTTKTKAEAQAYILRRGIKR